MERSLPAQQQVHISPELLRFMLTMEAVDPPVLPPLTIPTAVPDGEVIVPPTPTKQLLPLSETDGLTSGAVQPPGSTGENLSHTHLYEKKVARDTGDDSDSSFTEEGNFHEMIAINEVEDEEQRLIRSGGTGIPIGPVSKLYSFIPICLHANTLVPGWPAQTSIATYHTRICWP